MGTARTKPEIVVHDVTDDIVFEETVSNHLPWHQPHARRSRHLLVLRLGLVRRDLDSVRIERRASSPLPLLVDAFTLTPQLFILPSI